MQMPKTKPNAIRKAVKRYYRDMLAEDTLRNECYDSETTEIELNRFLRWLGADKPIGKRRGWSDLRRRYRGSYAGRQKK